MSLIGGKELESKLAAIEKKVSKKIVRQGVRKAQKALIPSIKMYLAGISKGGGMAEKISKALQVRATRKQKRGSYSINVQLKNDPAFIHYPKGASSSLSTKKTTGNRSYVPAAIEYGHGQNKEQSARPFMRPAADATVGRRITILVKEINAGLAKIWGKK
jgi:HK97 gp10 family phage protein